MEMTWIVSAAFLLGMIAGATLILVVTHFEIRTLIALVKSVRENEDRAIKMAFEALGQATQYKQVCEDTLDELGKRFVK